MPLPVHDAVSRWVRVRNALFVERLPSLLLVRLCGSARCDGEDVGHVYRSGLVPSVNCSGKFKMNVNRSRGCLAQFGAVAGINAVEAL